MQRGRGTDRDAGDPDTDHGALDTAVQRSIVVGDTPALRTIVDGDTSGKWSEMSEHHWTQLAT